MQILLITCFPGNVLMLDSNNIKFFWFSCFLRFSMKNHLVKTALRVKKPLNNKYI